MSPWAGTKRARCSAIIGSLRHTQIGPQTMRTVLGAKQRWTRDFRAGIINSQGQQPFSRRDTLAMTRVAGRLV
jgi:hypothetical protein